MTMEAAIARDQAHYDAVLEAEPGLPEPLPQGEQVLWRGAPDWRLLAVHVFHLRPLAALSALFAALSFTVGLAHRAPAPYLLLALAVPLLAGGVAMSLAAFSAWLVARVSCYTVTDARVVLRVGLLVPVNLNIPFSEITDVAMRPHPGGSGDLPLSVRTYKRISYMLLWPHVRPMQFKRPQPMLRAVRDAERAAEVLVNALRRAHGGRPELVYARPESEPGPEAAPEAPAGALMAAE